MTATTTLKLLALTATLGLLLVCGRQPQSYEELAAAGKKAYEQEDWTGACRYLSKALAEKPSDRDVLFMLGDAYFNDLMYDSAAVYLTRADLLHPMDRQILDKMRQACLRVRDWEKARKAMKDLVKLGDSEERYLPDLASASLSLGDFPWAHYYFRKLLYREPDRENWYIQVANTAAELGSLQVSIAVVDSAIAEFGATDELLLNKGTYLAADFRFEESERILRGLVVKDSTELQFLQNLANSLALQPERSKKLEAYGVYRIIAPRAPWELRVDSILAALERELNIDPDTINADTATRIF